MRGRAEEREDEALYLAMLIVAVFACTVYFFIVQDVLYTAFCVAHQEGKLKKMYLFFFQIDGQTRVPANSLPYSLLCPLIKPQKIIHHHTWSQQTHYILLCCHFDLYHASVLKDPGQALQRGQGSPLTAFNLIMDM